MTMAAAQLGMFGTAAADEREPRELAAIGPATERLNTPRLTAASLLGKVVLVDFWTYTCINWLRTLPYVRAWAQKYQQGLVVIGVHTPEFPFERNIDNVRAVQQMRIEYPIVIDKAVMRRSRDSPRCAAIDISSLQVLPRHSFRHGPSSRSAWPS